MNKTQQLHHLQQKGSLPGKVLFRPILMQFAADLGSELFSFFTFNGKKQLTALKSYVRKSLFFNPFPSKKSAAFLLKNAVHS